MDSPQPNQSTLETLRTVEFRLGLKGYNVDEVDEYLEKAAVEAEALQEQVRQMAERLRQASERIGMLEREGREAPAPQPAVAAAAVAAEVAISDDTLQRTLLLAQKFVDQTKRDSETEAAEMLAQAEERARATIAQSEERARQMSAEAEHRLREEVTRLEGMRGQLATDVENMARHLEAERNRLRGSLAEILKWVDDNIQPANSLMALRPRAGADQGRVAAGRPSPAAGANGSPESVNQSLDLQGGPDAG
ncbi:MAG TPA: DivIVA domain-containing protein [Acidimicrobiales bacterium]|jgi:cell division initiation protein|nr:DivIVA domain-containing protein [Acidimicrobiales bacterium]